MYPIHILKAEVISMFEDNPAKRLPFLAFQYLFEKHYHRSLSRSDIRRLKDIIQLIPPSNGNRNWLDSGGKYIVLSPRYKAAMTLPHLIEKKENIYPFCYLHCKDQYLNNDLSPWNEEEPFLALPLVNICLKKLTPRMHALLDSHFGSLPLNSLIACYTSEFNENFDLEGDTVPLEHLISCIPGIQISVNYDVGFKKVSWTQSKGELSKDLATPSIGSSSNDTLVKQLIQFSREVKDLLKNQPHCLISFSKFVPAYHNHFGRQCCVYQYGYTKLIELLEAIPHVVQILGEGSKRTLTLTHREQTKRFASDLIRVLKSQPKKRLILKDFPELYQKTLSKPFNISNYGVCNITDILVDVWEGTVIITYPPNGSTEDIIIEIPKKERTMEEKERTKSFARDVIELLQSTPSLSMPFSKFIPTYHHYFNRQCKVSDYGFVKLIELFEALSPEIVELDQCQSKDEKLIKLSSEQKRKIIGNRLVRIIKNYNCGNVPLNRINDMFRTLYGHSINFKAYGAESIDDLVSKLSDMLRIIETPNENCVTLIDKKWVKIVQTRSIKMLMERASGCMKVADICSQYIHRYGYQLDPNLLSTDLKEVVDIQNNSAHLTDLQKLVRECIISIQASTSGSLTFPELEDILNEKGYSSFPLRFGFKSMQSLLQSFTDYLTTIKVEEEGKFIWLLTVNSHFLDKTLIVKDDINLIERPISLLKKPTTQNVSSPTLSSPTLSSPNSHSSSSPSQTVKKSCLNSHTSQVVDIFNQALPFNLPSPQLTSHQNELNLISFESPPHAQQSEESNKSEKLNQPPKEVPSPPQDWIRSMKTHEVNTKVEAKKNKSSRIAANFSVNITE